MLNNSIRAIFGSGVGGKEAKKTNPFNARH